MKEKAIKEIEDVLSQLKERIDRNKDFDPVVTVEGNRHADPSGFYDVLTIKIFYSPEKVLASETAVV